MENLREEYFSLIKLPLIKIACLFLVFSFTTSAQVIQTARYEIPVFGDYPSFSALPWAENGLVLYRRTEHTKMDALQFIKLDSTLQENWSASIEVPKQLNLIFSKGHGNKAYFLFKPKNSFGDFQLVSLSPDSASSAVYTIKNVIPFNPTLFEVGNQSLIVAGYFNYRPVAIHFSMVTGLSKLLPGFFNDPGELDQLVINEDETIDVVINMRNADRRRSLWVMNFSSDGSSLKNTIINPPPDKHLIFGRMVKTSGDSSVIAGVYGRTPEFSRGVYIAIVNKAGEYTVRYYNFAELKNFFKYLRAPRQQRIQERIDRKKIKGKKIRFNYRIAVHEFVPYHDHYLLLGEAFFPVYKSSGYGAYRASPVYYGRYYSPGGWQQSGLVFDGYQYTHAVTIGIAKDGRLLWDNSFEIKNVKSYELNQYVHRLQGKNLNLLYSFDNKLYSKIIQGTNVIEGKSQGQMQSMFEGDIIKSKSTTNHKLEYWYGKYLLSFGVQEIENTKTQGVPISRKVFFVSKITFKE